MNNKHCPNTVRVVLIIRLFKTTLLLIPALLTVMQPPACAETAPTVSAASCVVMYEDGRTVYEKDPDARSLIASTTKLMTALVCLENARLDDRVTIPPACCQIEGSSMYLKAGESYTVRELLLGLLLASGNDAALALAQHVSGSAESFVRLMNEKAEGLSLNQLQMAGRREAEKEFSKSYKLFHPLTFLTTAAASAQIFSISSNFPPLIRSFFTIQVPPQQTMRSDFRYSSTLAVLTPPVGMKTMWL